MEQEVLMIILKWSIPIILTSMCTALYKIYKDNKAVKLALLSIIRSQIVSKCESYQNKGYLPEYARYCLEDLFKQYKVLGGNHGVEILVNNTFTLPSTLPNNDKEELG